MHPGIFFPLEKKVTLPSKSTVERIVDTDLYVAVVNPLVRAIECDVGAKVEL
jgi:hypothetical protein